MVNAIDNLREVRRRCQSGEPLGEDLSGWLNDGISAFLERECSRLDHAFGLQFAQGGVPWWKEEAIRTRDRALRELAATYSAGLSVNAKAKQIRTLSIRYAATSWRRDRVLLAMPPAYSGTRREHLWRAFTSGAAMPISERQLRQILV